MFPASNDQPIPSIIELNRDVESLIIQASGGRSKFFKDPFKPLQFVHLTDVHAKAELWARMCEYVDYYSDFISFALHTGDYCNHCQQAYTDLYAHCTPKTGVVLNCVGNHDTYLDPAGQMSDKKTTYDLLFNHIDGWDVTFMPGECSMTYYKDFPESNLRLIVLDCYYGADQQLIWLQQVLDQAREQGLHVITAAHEPTGQVTHKMDVTFQTIEDFERFGDHAQYGFEQLIAAFKRSGGIHVCHLAGHDHFDTFGYTDMGILNVVAACATDWPHWCDGKRLRGTRTYDCFNVVSVDVNQHHLKLVRVGNNADHYLRVKRALCFDYVQGKVISNE